jgi:plastocyanin
VPSFQKEVVVLALYRMSVPGAGALVALLTCFAYAGIAEAKPITVTMKSLSYEPKTVEIHIGDTIAWTNASLTKHTATSDDDGKNFNSGEIKSGETSTSIKFDKAGEFKYHCQIHGRAMHGTITVKAE